ncbi:MAG TPA: S8 family serine peptidase [Alphaproteobacteria bacterium]|nr:S8 family serine peptidase [Alphaproteobacteria bacterium]
MKSVRSLSVMMCAVVSIMLLGDPAFAHQWESPRKIVVFQRGISGEAQRQIAAGARARVLHMLPIVNGIAIELPSGRRAQALEELRWHSAVFGVYEDHVITAAHSSVSITPVETPATEIFPWGVQRIGVPAVVGFLGSKNGPRPRVAVVDTGIDPKHPDLSGQLAGGYNARADENPGSFQDDNGHGTHMAGIIAATANNLGVIGVASHPALVAVKVLDHTGHGYLSDLINGLQWVLNKGIRVVNMSLSFSEDSPLLAEVTYKLYQEGVILVASAGNRCTFTPRGSEANDAGGDDAGGDDAGGDDAGGDDAGGDDAGGDDAGGDDAGGDDAGGDDAGGDDAGGDDAGGDDAGGDDWRKVSCDTSLDPLQGGVNYPARYDWVIAVGATDANNQVTNYSRSGPELDVVAPGGTEASGKILSTTLGRGYGVGAGTSQATAHVTGAVAAVLELAPDLSVDEVMQLLRRTATDLYYSPELQGAGLIAVDTMVYELLGDGKDANAMDSTLLGLP